MWSHTCEVVHPMTGSWCCDFPQIRDLRMKGDWLTGQRSSSTGLLDLKGMEPGPVCYRYICSPGWKTHTTLCKGFRQFCYMTTRGGLVWSLTWCLSLGKNQTFLSSQHVYGAAKTIAHSSKERPLWVKTHTHSPTVLQWHGRKTLYPLPPTHPPRPPHHTMPMSQHQPMDVDGGQKKHSSGSGLCFHWGWETGRWACVGEGLLCGGGVSRRQVHFYWSLNVADKLREDEFLASSNMLSTFSDVFFFFMME